MQYRKLVAVGVAVGLAVTIGLAWAASKKEAAKGTGTHQSGFLYSDPDPESKGGIHAKIGSPNAPIVCVFAQSLECYTNVYKGEVMEGGHEFRFAGLPVGKYDLVIFYANAFWEGLTLTREDDTLTAKDRKSIETTTMKSEPYFNEKKIHRLAGTTGRAGKARLVYQEVRTLPVTLQSGEIRSDIQTRSLRLGLAEDIGSVGWTLTEVRQIIRQEVTASDFRGFLAHHYSEKLGNIRVVDSEKDLGQLQLQ